MTFDLFRTLIKPVEKVDHRIYEITKSTGETFRVAIPESSTVSADAYLAETDLSDEGVEKFIKNFKAIAVE